MRLTQYAHGGSCACKIPPATGNVEEEIPTINDLFDEIDRADDDGADLVDVAYHLELGYPAYVAIDPTENAIDDETCFTISGYHLD